MKIQEMTHEQVVALTDYELERLIKVRMAEEGIPILDCPMRAEARELPNPDVTVYTAECLGELGFTDREEFLAVVDTLRSMPSLVRYTYDYSLKCARVHPGYANQYSDGSQAFNLKIEQGRSLTQLRIVEDAVRAVNAAEKAFEDEMKVYQKVQADAKGIREEIYGVYREHLNIDIRREKLWNLFHQYLDLADGNAEIAMRFLEKVESLTDAERDVLLAKVEHEGGAWRT